MIKVGSFQSQFNNRLYERVCLDADYSSCSIDKGVIYFDMSKRGSAISNALLEDGTGLDDSINGGLCCNQYGFCCFDEHCCGSLICNQGKCEEQCTPLNDECSDDCGCNITNIVCRHDPDIGSTEPKRCMECITENEICLLNNDCCQNTTTLICNSYSSECQPCGHTKNSGKKKEVQCMRDSDCCANLICDDNKKECKQAKSKSSSSSSSSSSSKKASKMNAEYEINAHFISDSYDSQSVESNKDINGIQNEYKNNNNNEDNIIIALSPRFTALLTIILLLIIVGIIYFCKKRLNTVSDKHELYV